jgi:hypothetical protein
MRELARHCTVWVLGAAAILSAAAAPSQAGGATQNATTSDTAKDAVTIEAFQNRVKDYVKLREKIEGSLPNLSSEATPEEIEAHKKGFQERVQAERAGAKPGDIFGADIAAYIRATLREEATRKDKKTVLEAETKGVPMRVNYPYPESKEFSQTPPTLLLRLPELPKQMKYRFVGRNLLLVDRENGLIVDFMPGAMP